MMTVDEAMTWVLRQLMRRHPYLTFSYNPSFIPQLRISDIKKDIFVSVPFEDVVTQVEERQHSHNLEYEIDVLFSLLCRLERDANLPDAIYI
jgi:hypothetical protein